MLSTSTGLTKTVYNPAALKAAQKTLLVSTPAVDNNEAQKKKQVSRGGITYKIGTQEDPYSRGVCVCFMCDVVCPCVRVKALTPRLVGLICV